MSKAAVYYWAPSEGPGYQDGIAKAQAVAAGANLILAANTPTNNGGIFSYVNTIKPNISSSGTSANIIRTINTLTTSAGGTTYTIKGIGVPVGADGNPTQIVGPIPPYPPGSMELLGPLVGPIIEEIVVPSGAAVVAPSLYIYTEIHSIESSNAVTSVSVGYGPSGITGYYDVDNNRDTAAVYGLTYSYQMTNNTTLTAATNVSLNKPWTSNNIGGLEPFGVINGTLVGFIPAFQLDSGITQNTINSVPQGVSVIWANISNCTTDSMFFTVLQDGL